MENEKVKRSKNKADKEATKKEKENFDISKKLKSIMDKSAAAEEHRTEALNRLADAIFALASSLEALSVQSAPEEIDTKGFKSVETDELPF